MLFRRDELHLVTLAILLCLQSICFAQAEQGVQIIYGVKQAQAFKTSSNPKLIVLYLGSFRNKQKALQYQTVLNKKTRETINLLYHPSLKKTPWTLVKTFRSTEELHRFSTLVLTKNAEVRKVLPKKETKKTKPSKKVTEQPKPLMAPHKKIAKGKTTFSKDKRIKFVALSLGLGATQPGKPQTLSTTSGNPSNYYPTNSPEPVMSAELTIGVDKKINQKTDSQLGVALVYDSNVTLNGDVWVNADPNFNNFTYAYKVRHFELALKGKAIAEKQTFSWLKEFKPYLSGRLGLGFNQSSNYGMTPKIFGAVVPPLFQSKVVSAFSYALGLGVEKEINKHLNMSAGYTFSDWGRSHLASASGQETRQGIGLSHLYTNKAEFGLTYLS